MTSVGEIPVLPPFPFTGDLPMRNTFPFELRRVI